jgi:Suppressor of fused protein (SUFU)
VDYQQFYGQLFAPLVAKFGPLDRDTLCAILGFGGGGPLSFCTIGMEKAEEFVTYVSCELAVRQEQSPSSAGRYELLCSCDDERWVRSIVSKLGQMSLHAAFGDGHAVDISELVEPDVPLQAVWIELEYSVTIDNEEFSIYRVIGVTRQEMEYMFAQGSAALKSALQTEGIYPHTSVARSSVV